MKLIITIIILMILFTGCQYPGETFTDFEELNLSQRVGENITIQGTTIIYTFMTTKNYKNDFYGLRDTNGFEVAFIPRGDRHIELQKVYRIKGEVIKDKPVTCSEMMQIEQTECEDIYFLKEIKP